MPWQIIIVGVLFILILSIAVHFFFFSQQFSEQDIKNRIVQFYDKMNKRDIRINDWIEPSLSADFSLEKT
ncbi:MAG: hypothetical protein KatS3mg035_1262 [Bacteroidia bacterium]|nr:MAG: hypothetical protein KatS3mg035_1262 [Bacteroidia bacterium]